MNIMKESFVYFKKYMPAWITVVLLGFVCVITQSLLPQAPQLIIDRIINPLLGAQPVINENNVFSNMLSHFSSDDYFGMFLFIATIFISISVIRYFSHYIRWYVSHVYGVKAEKDLRLAVFGKMLSQNSLVMARYTSGDLMSICHSDCNTVKALWSQDLSLLLDQFLIIGFAIFFLSRINWTLMIVPLFTGLTTIVIMVFYIKALRRRYNDIRECSAELNSCIQENINGVRIVRAYTTENIEVQKFDRKNDKFKDSFIRHTKTHAIYNVWFNGLSQSVSFGSTIIGVVLAVKGKISLGEFTTFLAYVGMINAPMIAIANFMGAVQNAMICGNRLFTFLNTANFISDPENPLEITEKPSISLRNVSIKLDENEELKNVSLEIPYGKKLGIMGKTGAGKSVLLKALPRFFETTNGETCINEVNIKKYRVEDVRQQFSYVMQDVFLFSNTVESNIAFYNPEAPQESVVKAAKIADAHGFIEKLAQGYQTIVGEKGLGLSGGQKQRLSIARALLKDAPVLMLDDCTSALDLETERRILKDIKENYDDKTLIIASHRTSSVENCDEIVFLENGEITERGTHTELLEKKGSYYEIYKAQEAARREVIA